MAKLCVVFPGRRYSADRSLLYYPSKMMEEKGYQMIYLHYDLPKENEDPRPLERCFDDCFKASKEQLSNIDFSSYEKVVFLSKSIGTAVSGAIKKEFGVENVYQIMITPLTMTVPYMDKKDLVIASNKDRYLPDAEDALANLDNAYLFPNCPHSFEFPEDFAMTMKMLNSAVSVIEKYLSSIQA